MKYSFVCEIWALLRCYAAQSGNSVPTFRDKLSVPSSKFENWTSWALNMGPICWPEPSLTNYYYALRNIPLAPYLCVNLPSSFCWNSTALVTEQSVNIQYFQDYSADKHKSGLNQVILKAMQAYPQRVGSSSSENIFLGPPVRADRLKVFTLNRNDWLSFAKLLEHSVVRKRRLINGDKRNILGPQRRR
jgi:hypothetical protein